MCDAATSIKQKSHLKAIFFFLSGAIIVPLLLYDFVGSSSRLNPETYSWTLLTRAGGGFSGEITGSVLITSNGDVVAEGPHRQQKLGCVKRPTLKPEDLAGLKQIITSAHPAAWKLHYALPTNSGGCCDQIGYSLDLLLHKEDGSDQRHTTSWYESSIEMRPGDLKILHAKAVAIQQNALSKCAEASHQEVEGNFKAD